MFSTQVTSDIMSLIGQVAIYLNNQTGDDNINSKKGSVSTLLPAFLYEFSSIDESIRDENYQKSINAIQTQINWVQKLEESDRASFKKEGFDIQSILNLLHSMKNECALKIDHENRVLFG